MSPSAILLVLISLFLSGISCSNEREKFIKVSRIEWGREQLYAALKKAGYPEKYIVDNTIKIGVDPSSDSLIDSSRKSEGYRVIVKDSMVTILGNDAAGAMYGCLDLAHRVSSSQGLPSDLDVTDAPVMNLRGTCILLMKLGTYNYPITPEEFPFFYDKDLWLEYLDFLAANRFNYIAFWNGHPFAYFVKLDKFPEAQDGMDPALLQRNHDMLIWLCQEGAKRNIRFIFEFYNIHTSVYFQKAHGLPDGILKPTPLLEKYTAYCIERFVSEFPQVGLFITPGEALELEYANAWLNDVIFSAVKRSGRTPPVFVRAWSYDLEHAKKLVGKYPDLYFVRKYNVEMLAGTDVDPENAEWARLTGKHVVNIHCIANLEPFRWNPPSYIQKCLQSAVKAGANGLHLYPRKAWRWPFGCDVGEKKPQWHRDALWFEIWGRYAWNPNYNQDTERAYWLQRLTGLFGNDLASKHLLESFETGADVLPALQRLLWLGNDNHTIVCAGAKLSALETAQGIPFLPLEVSRIPDYLAQVIRQSFSEKSPVQFLQTVMEKANTSWQQASLGAKLATQNVGEAHRIESDAQAIALVSEFYYYKLQALERKILFDNGINPDANQSLFVTHLKRSLECFRELVDLTAKTYDSISDVPAWNPERLKMCPYHWSDILPIYERELAIYLEDMELAKDPVFREPNLPGLAGILYGDPGLKYPKRAALLDSLIIDQTELYKQGERRWSAQWFGYIVSTADSRYTFYAAADQGATLMIDGKELIKWTGSEGRHKGYIDLVAGKPVPVRIIYNHDGGKKPYLRITWSWAGKPEMRIPAANLKHSPAQERRMKRSILLH